MNFLALSTAQALLLGLLTTIAVVVIFFVRLRHRRAVVSSALLWERVLRDDISSSLTEKLRRWLSLALALAIALLIALSVGRPYVAALGVASRPVVVVLDTSPSMETRTATGQTRWEVATERAKEIIGERTSVAGLMAADTAGRVRTLLTEESALVVAAIDSMRPFPGEQRFPNFPAVNADLYFVTDGVGSIDAPPSATTVSVFEPAENVAITAFEVRVDPVNASGYAAYLEVVNYSETDKEVAIVLSGAGGQRLASNVQLESAEAWRGALDLTEFTGGGLRVRIQADGDDLELDDVAFSYLPPRRDTRVLLVTPTTGGYLETLLRLSRRVNLTVVAPADFQEDAAIDAYVFEGYAPPTEPNGPSLVFGASEVPWLPPRTGTATDQAITTWNGDHPVMRFVPVYDLKIDASAVVDPEDWAVVAASDDAPLVLVSDATYETVFVGFGLEESDFAFHLGFPIFVENTLAWFAGEELADHRSLGEIELNLVADTISGLDGEPFDAETLFGRTLLEVTEPDLVTVVSNNRRLRIAANLTDPSISNVNRSSLSGPNSTGFTARPVGENELWFYMLLLAMILAAVEWWTYNRRVTV